MPPTTEQKNQGWVVDKIRARSLTVHQLAPCSLQCIDVGRGKESIALSIGRFLSFITECREQILAASQRIRRLKHLHQQRRALLWVYLS